MTLPFIDVILIFFFFSTNIDWSAMSITLFFSHIRSKSAKILRVSHPRKWATFVSVMDGYPSGSNLGNTFLRTENVSVNYITNIVLSQIFIKVFSGKQYSSCSRSGGRMNTGWSIDSSQVRRSLPPPFFHYYEHCWQ